MNVSVVFSFHCHTCTYVCIYDVCVCVCVCVYIYIYIYIHIYAIYIHMLCISWIQNIVKVTIGSRKNHTKCRLPCLQILLQGKLRVKIAIWPMCLFFLTKLSFYDIFSGWIVEVCSYVGFPHFYMRIYETARTYHHGPDKVCTWRKGMK